MLFNSFDFLLFILPVLGAYFLCPRAYRWIILLVASFVFYAWSKPVYLALLSTTILSTWYAGLLMDRSDTMQQRRLIMRLAVFLNLAILVVFKYLGLFNEIFDWFSIKATHHPASFHLPELLLPVGISFYTFQSIGYVLDVYYKIRKPEPQICYYAVFVSFFPQILSGPIGRSTELLPQFRNHPKVTWIDIENGIGRFAWGLFKKVVIADRIGDTVDAVYSNLPHYHGPVYLLIMFLYAFQLYADFSAYTDMAIGIARCLGFRLAENFDFPYISRSVTEFWRRWHLSLSNWLRDYLYTPILFRYKRKGQRAVIYAIFITFLICGIWHGARFTFVVFGILQSLALTYEMLTRARRQQWNKTLPKLPYNFISWAITFTFVVICFVFFRAATVDDAWKIISGGFGSILHLSQLGGFVAEQGGARLLFSLALLAIFLLADRSVSNLLKNETADRAMRRALVLGTLCALTLAFGTFGKVNFIYFRF